MTFYAFIVFLSAFLLFQIEPMIAKSILPWFGGTPAVWSTTMLFFQVLLTSGYACAYWLIGRVAPRRQGYIYVALLGVSLTVLGLVALSWKSPITPDAAWKPHALDFPVLDIFKILTVSVGLPYFLLATNSPLMQAWFSRDHPTRSPYRLYALSNLGSLLALVSYPALIEPSVTLSAQGWLWSIGFLVFALFGVYGAIKTIRGTSGVAASTQTATTTAGDPPPRAAEGVLWVALAACASVLLLAVTSQMTQEVAVIPFLWVLPLTIYLLSFILTFDSDRWYSRTLFMYAFFAISAIYTVVVARGPGWNLGIQITVYSLMLFICCMICHGELVRLKPHPRYLTSFYLLVSIGGAVGGIAVGLIAPYIFKGFWELPIGLLACALFALMVNLIDRHNIPFGRFRINVTLIAGATIIFAYGLFAYIKASNVDSLLTARNFYGVLRVTEINADNPDQSAYLLAHGATSHGFQFIPSVKRRQPTTYYTEKSGIGLAFLNHPKRPGPLRVGVMGLGIGTLASYIHPADTLTFYEINPDVIHLAEGAGGYFSYLKDAPAQAQIVQGDARISLEQELAAGLPQRFDLLVLDTFNSDSIPVHLITREAFEIYLQHLQPNGILALHISNNHLDLRPVVYNLADTFDLGVAYIETPADDEGAFLSEWMLVTRDEDLLHQTAIAQRTSPRPADTNRIKLWTDDYSNLFQVLR